MAGFSVTAWKENKLKLKTLDSQAVPLKKKMCVRPITNKANRLKQQESKVY